MGAIPLSGTPLRQEVSDAPWGLGRYAGAMKGTAAIQEMQAKERADWLRETWGMAIQDSSSAKRGHPMDILREGSRIGRIVRSENNNWVVLELPWICDLDSDKAFGPDAVEIWDFRYPQDDLAGDDAVERINALIYCSVGAWAERQGLGTA